MGFVFYYFANQHFFSGLALALRGVSVYFLRRYVNVTNEKSNFYYIDG